MSLDIDCFFKIVENTSESEVMCVSDSHVCFRLGRFLKAAYTVS